MRVVRGVQSASRARCGLQRVRSGEDGFPDLGRRVGKSRLRSVRLLSLIASTIAEPLPAAAASLVEEYHAALWALKSPMTMVVSLGFSRRERSGRKWVGQDEAGGM